MENPAHEGSSFTHRCYLSRKKRYICSFFTPRANASLIEHTEPGPRQEPRVIPSLTQPNPFPFLRSGSPVPKEEGGVGGKKRC